MGKGESNQNEMAAIKVAKKEIRRKIKAALANVSHEDVAHQSRSTLPVLLSMPEYKAAKKVGIYLSMPAGEINTRDVVHDAFRNGKQVFVPYIYKQVQPREDQPTSIMDMLELQSLDEYESLNRDSWGIPTLPADSVVSRWNCLGNKGLSEGSIRVMGENDGLDLIVMPGSVFDIHMGRVGHGKGFYDFFLQRYRESNDCGPKQKMPSLVGLSLSEQLLSSNQTVPRDASDWLLDALITGHGRLFRSSESRPNP